MDPDTSKRMQSEAMTDAFRIVCLLEIDVGIGMLPLGDIVEAEAKARAERIIGEHLEIKKKQMGTKKALTAWAMRASELGRPEDFPV